MTRELWPEPPAPSSVRYYGAVHRSVQAAIEKIFSIGLLPSHRTALVFEDGRLQTLSDALRCLAADMRAMQTDNGVSLYRYALYPEAEPWVRLEDCQMRSVPHLVADLLQGTPLVKVGGILSGLDDACYVLARWYHNDTCRHKRALSSLWSRRTPTSPNQQFLYEFVLIDDDRKFCDWFVNSMPKEKVRVHAYQSIQKYSNDVMKGEIPPPESIDLFLLDIVDESAGEVVLAGLQRDLPSLTRERLICSFPQIFMLSDLPADRVSHLCFKAGANYYIEKVELLLASDPAALLLDRVVNCASVQMGLDGGDDSSARTDGPSTGGEGEEDAKSRVKRLFGSRWKVKQADQLQSYKGRSGAETAAWRIWEDGVSTPLAPRIVKIGDPGKLEREWIAYHRHLAAIETHSFGHIEHFFGRSEKKAAISYTLAGTETEFRYGSVNSWCETVDREPPSLCPRIFRSLLAPLHDKRRFGFVPLRRVLDFMATELEPLEVSFPSSTGECRYRVSRVSTEKVEPNVHFHKNDDAVGRDHFAPEKFPIYCAQLGGTSGDLPLRVGKWFKGSPVPDGKILASMNAKWQSELIKRDCAESLRKFTIGLEKRLSDTISSVLKGQLDIPVLFTLVHGDLNLNNVLVSESGERLWLIDFGNTRPGPPAIDYVTAEFELRFQILRPLLHSRIEKAVNWFSDAKSLLQEFEIATQDAAIIDHLSHYSGSKPEAERSFKAGWRMILELRDIAASEFYRDSQGHATYDLVFSLFAAKVLQRYKTELNDGDGPLGIIWAAVALDISLQRLEEFAKTGSCGKSGAATKAAHSDS